MGAVEEKGNHLLHWSFKPGQLRQRVTLPLVGSDYELVCAFLFAVFFQSRRNLCRINKPILLRHYTFVATRMPQRRLRLRHPAPPIPAIILYKFSYHREGSPKRPRKTPTLCTMRWWSWYSMLSVALGHKTGVVATLKILNEWATVAINVTEKDWRNAVLIVSVLEPIRQAVRIMGGDNRGLSWIPEIPPILSSHTECHTVAFQGRFRRSRRKSADRLRRPV